MVKKTQARLISWAHRWLSTKGRLVLFKFVLSSIPVYWATITKIPKVILSNIRKVCFHFLCAGKREVGSIPLVKWPRIAMPKDLGGWGIKNINWFSKSLAAKSL
jgi:hypothetical protein